MTRRAFLAALLPMSGTIAPVSGMDGFSVSGVLTEAGTQGDGYFAIENVVLMLDPAKHPSMVAGARALLNTEVRLTLTRS